MKWILILVLCSPAYAATITRDAKIYAIGKTKEAPIFLQKTQLDTNDKGITHEQTSITDPEGHPVLTQDSEFRGEHLISQHVRQFQTRKAFTVSVSGNEIVFQTFDFDGKSETLSKDGQEMEKLDSPFLTGPVADSFISAHWKALMNGDTLHVRFGVLELAETVAFKFWETDEKPNELARIRMKPSSLFISMAVKPIDLLFNRSTQLMVGYIGRTPLRVLEDGKLVPFDGEIIYQN